MRYLLLMATLILILLFFANSWALSMGETAPYFKITDGNNRSLVLNSIYGKVIVGFYECKEYQEKNRELKSMLHSFYQEFPEISTRYVYKLAVVDSSSASFATRWLWEKNMRAASEYEKVNIYGDWDGSMREAYGFSLEESIFIIIDKKGIVEFLRKGVVPAADFEQIKNLIKILTNVK